MTSRTVLPRQGFVPPYLLERLAAAGHEGARDTLGVDDELRTARLRRASGTVLPAGVARSATPLGGPAWRVHDAKNGATLPGTVVLRPGDPVSGDPAVQEAVLGIEATLAMFAQEFGRDSYDGRGVRVDLTAHYRTRYDNAFWDGSHLVFGDGDGEVFERFTRAPDVLAHEFGHAVTERTAGLVYSDQSGALNESVSDVFAACLRQRLAGQGAAEGDWLVGADLFRPGVGARALRDMAAPGTAYDDPRLGKDPQVGHLDDYVHTDDDNGGVHLNSGIANKAFQLAAVAIGGESAAGAGAVWYRALSSGDVRPDADFAGFAAACVAAAGRHADAVRDAWAQVGVTPAQDSGAGARVTVVRSGGLAGRRLHGSVDLDASTPAAHRVRATLARLDEADAWRDVTCSAAVPDAFTYRIECPHREPLMVGENDLTPPLADLVDQVLAEGAGPGE